MDVLALGRDFVNGQIIAIQRHYAEFARKVEGFVEQGASRSIFEFQIEWQYVFPIQVFGHLHVDDFRIGAGRVAQTSKHLASIRMFGDNLKGVAIELGIAVVEGEIFLPFCDLIQNVGCSFKNWVIIVSPKSFDQGIVFLVVDVQYILIEVDAVFSAYFTFKQFKIRRKLSLPDGLKCFDISIVTFFSFCGGFEGDGIRRCRNTDQFGVV